MRRDGHLDDAVQTVFKDAVGLLNLAQREGVGNKRRGVQQGGIDCKINAHSPAKYILPRPLKNRNGVKNTVPPGKG